MALLKKLTPSDKIARLREILGDAALARITDLDRRDIQRIAQGDAALRTGTARRLQTDLREAAGLAGVETSASAQQVVERVVAAYPRSVSTIRVALALYVAGRPMAFADICEGLTGARDVSSIQGAIHDLAAAGLVEIEGGNSDHPHAKQAVWVG